MVAKPRSVHCSKSKLKNFRKFPKKYMLMLSTSVTQWSCSFFDSDFGLSRNQGFISGRSCIVVDDQRWICDLEAIGGLRWVEGDRGFASVAVAGVTVAAISPENSILGGG
jgi:hypothetical protein